MAYLRVIKRPSGIRYIYVMKSIREGDRVFGKVLEYLGRADKVMPERLRRACEYWGVKPKVAKRRRAKVGRRKRR